MKKCLNSSDSFVDDSLLGIVKAHPENYRFATDDTRGVIYDGNVDRKVKIVTGGGYGHLPLFLGYVGKGLCDGIAVGNVFTSPSSETIVNVAKDLQSDQILFLFGNYFGDTMNFDMAADMLESEDIDCMIMKSADDLASSDILQNRRGIAGILFAYKIAGAAADRGYDLDTITAITREALENITSLGVAFSSCVLPGEKKPIFEIGESEIEIGMGIHGEPGIHRGNVISSKDLARLLVEDCFKDLKICEAEEIAVLVNGLGSTSREELYVLYNDMETVITENKVTIKKVYIGEYVTSMEMAGLSLSIMRLNDDRLELLKVPAYSPFVNFF